MKNLLRKIAPTFLLSWYHFAWALLGALLYGFSARKLVVIGVTGTNGKSTTVEMISRILQEVGFKTASTSSIRFQIGNEEWSNKFKMTMPGRFFIQGFLRKAVNEGCTHAVIEVTSEGILQHRHRFLNFHTAVFTNLSPEHIERHGSFEKYREAKGKLFAAAKQVHVLNADDEHALYFLSFPSEKLYLYGSSPEFSLRFTPFAEWGPTRLQKIQSSRVVENEGGVSFQVDDVSFHLKLLGRFQAYNALAAIAVARSQGISLQVCSRALEKMEVVPGRMETIVQKPFRVVVDYAFTPAALEKVYKTFRENPKSEARNSKLICILGAAGGGRDRWKRPVLGKIAATYCDRVIITDEDPYEEDPEKIMNEVHEGTQGKGEIIVDRREAMKAALSGARPGDVVVITGKGSEDSIATKGGKRIPWDDREVVREEMRARLMDTKE